MHLPTLTGMFINHGFRPIRLVDMASKWSKWITHNTSMH